MNPGVLRVLALIVAAASLMLSAASVVLIALTPGLSPLAGWGFVGYDAVFAITYAAVGLLITLRRPSNRIAWLFLLSAVLSGVQTVSASYAFFGTEYALRGADVAYWVTNWIWIPAVAVIVHTLLLYPNGRLPAPRWRWAGIGLLPVTVLVTLLWAVATPEVATGDAFMYDPLALDPEHPLRAVAGPSILVLMVWFLIAAASLRERMRSGSDVERQQVKWIALSAALLGITMGISVVLSLFTPSDSGPAKASQVLSVLTVLLVPILATVAILRYRLYDIDVLINRTLVYGATSAALIGTYVVSVLFLGGVLRPLTGSGDVAVAGSTLAVVALFAPLRSRIQDLVDHRFYRARYDAARTLDRFGMRLRDHVDLDQLDRELIGVLDETMRPAHASLWLRRPR